MLQFDRNIHSMLCINALNPNHFIEGLENQGCKSWAELLWPGRFGQKIATFQPQIDFKALIYFKT